MNSFVQRSCRTVKFLCYVECWLSTCVAWAAAAHICTWSGLSESSPCADGVFNIVDCSLKTFGQPFKILHFGISTILCHFCRTEVIDWKSQWQKKKTNTVFSIKDTVAILLDSHHRQPCSMSWYAVWIPPGNPTHFYKWVYNANNNNDYIQFVMFLFAVISHFCSSYGCCRIKQSESLLGDLCIKP